MMLTEKCNKDNSVFPFSACSLVSASVVSPDIHSGFPCFRTSSCAKEHTSPTPVTSTVKFLKKSTMLCALYRKLSIKMNGVSNGLNSSSAKYTFEMRQFIVMSKKLIINPISKQGVFFRPFPTKYSQVSHLPMQV